MGRQVEVLSHKVLALQGQLRDSETKREEEREQHELLMGNLRCELEANHIIELVAQKEECKASKMHTQSEQAAQRRAEQELHREIDHVRRLRAELEDMEVMEYSYVCHLPRLIRARVSFARVSFARAHAQV